ncbi:MAG: efflux RND transporter periplasmic adaptor subunit [Planctomycetota bacterium]
MPSRTVLVAPAQSGVLARVRVEEGAAVDKDEALGQLDTRLEELRVERLGKLANDDVEVRLAAATLAYAKKEEERARRLSEQDIGNLAQLQKLELETEIAQIKLEEARLKQEIARLTWEEAKARLEQRIIRSPIKGVITTKLKQMGEAVEKLEPVFRVVSLEPLWIEFNCAVRDEERIEIGTEFRIRRAGRPDTTKTARAIYKERVVDPSSQTLRVRLKLDNRGRPWKAGRKVLIELVSAGSSTPGK